MVFIRYGSNFGAKVFFSSAITGRVIMPLYIIITIFGDVICMCLIPRRLEIIVERITCNGTEENLSDCLLEVSENPPVTDLSLVYISCGKLRYTCNM